MFTPAYFHRVGLSDNTVNQTEALRRLIQHHLDITMDNPPHLNKEVVIPIDNYNQECIDLILNGLLKSGYNYNIESEYNDDAHYWSKTLIISWRKQKSITNYSFAGFP